MDKSFVANEEDQWQYQQALEDHVINPNQLIYVNKSQKDQNSSLHCRLWSKNDQPSFCPSYLISIDGKQCLLLAACDLDGFVTEAYETVLQSTGPNDTDLTHGTIDTVRCLICGSAKNLFRSSQDTIVGNIVP